MAGIYQQYFRQTVPASQRLEPLYQQRKRQYQRTRSWGEGEVGDNISFFDLRKFA